MTGKALALQIPRNPKKTCELQCHHFCYLITLPMRDVRQTLSLWDDEGCTLPGESHKILKFYTCTCILMQLCLMNSSANIFFLKLCRTLFALFAGFLVPSCPKLALVFGECL